MSERHTEVQANDCIVCIYEFDDKSDTRRDDKAFLTALHDALLNWCFEVQLIEVMQSSDRAVLKDLERTCEMQKRKRPILAYPDEQFCELHAVVTFDAIMEQQKQSFVILIIRIEKFLKLPHAIQELHIRRVMVDTVMTDVEGIVIELQDFFKDESASVDYAFINSGTGLAWSYYFGYLAYMLPEFVKRLLNSTWRKSHPEIPDGRISKKLFIVFTTNCREPKILNSERIKVSEPIIELKKDRAGVKREYDVKISEVRSRDGEESYYGVVCFLDVVQVLTEMRDDPNKGFVKYSENDMKMQGKHCFEKLKLFMKYTRTCNKKFEIDQSTCDFIEFDTDTHDDENELADVILDRMREACTTEVSDLVRSEMRSLEVSSSEQETGTTGAHQTGILYSAPITGDIKKFVDDFSKSNRTKQITECPPDDDRVEFGLKLIGESKRIFMVLTDEFVTSDAFANWSYKILEKGYHVDKRRFVVCLNCLSQNVHHPNVLDLRLLFSSVSHTDRAGWPDKVRAELMGDVRAITDDLHYYNIGTGLAMSWYYRFLKIQIPKVRDVIDQCPALKKKFENNEMSHKVFFLHPHSCRCQKKVSDADPEIKLVENKDINLPKVKKAKRDYTPQVYCLRDEDGKEYYAFVEFNAQADTMYQMMQQKFITESILKKEWARFCNKLYTLINHKDEPMDIKNRTVFIPYDDKDLKDGKLAGILLDDVKREIRKERPLPAHIENGAVVKRRDGERTEPPPAAAGGDAGASAW